MQIIVVDPYLRICACDNARKPANFFLRARTQYPNFPGLNRLFSTSKPHWDTSSLGFYAVVYSVARALTPLKPTFSATMLGRVFFRLLVVGTVWSFRSFVWVLPFSAKTLTLFSRCSVLSARLTFHPLESLVLKQRSHSKRVSVLSLQKHYSLRNSHDFQILFIHRYIDIFRRYSFPIMSLYSLNDFTLYTLGLYIIWMKGDNRVFESLVRLKLSELISEPLIRAQINYNCT